MTIYYQGLKALDKYIKAQIKLFARQETRPRDVLGGQAAARVEVADRAGQVLSDGIVHALLALIALHDPNIILLPITTTTIIIIIVVVVVNIIIVIFVITISLS